MIQGLSRIYWLTLLGINTQEGSVDESEPPKRKSFDIALGINEYLFQFATRFKPNALPFSHWPDEMVEDEKGNPLRFDNSFFHYSFPLAMTTFEAISPEGKIRFNLGGLDEKLNNPTTPIKLPWFTLFELRHIIDERPDLQLRTVFYDYKGLGEPQEVLPPELNAKLNRLRQLFTQL